MAQAASAFTVPNHLLIYFRYCRKFVDILFLTALRHFVYFRNLAYKMANSPSYFQQVDAGGGVLQSNVADDIRTHFRTREGVYRLMKLSEYSRPTRSPPNGPNTTPFRIAFVSAPDSYNRRVDDLLAFIVGKELYVYYYNGVRKVRTGLHSVVMCSLLLNIHYNRQWVCRRSAVIL